MAQERQDHKTFSHLPGHLSHVAILKVVNLKCIRIVDFGDCLFMNINYLKSISNNVKCFNHYIIHTLVKAYDDKSIEINGHIVVNS